ncbi:TerB family tellurite resistance protein [Vannielia litorea]|uniref:tellurite resistance TerB family protein n=1 Tax=Vannielia litorea TaxID=1217970 RepID=UPI001BCE12F8|nr:TerB family tellurite resistance protein [Vannielia litorea]MBS8225755.1 TerB family tellurite resistance protein [Vannielia litorea]
MRGSMTGGSEFEDLSELEAAIILYAATVVADGEVHAKETEELVQQIKLIVGDLGKSATEFEANLSEFLQHLNTEEGTSPLELNRQQVMLLAGLIESDDLKIQVMNAIFEIAYADDDYHDTEREIVTILRECWGV